MSLPPVCPICAAVVLRDSAKVHFAWHATTHTLNGWTEGEALERIAFQEQWERPVGRADDEAPTQKFPPIGETVLRRPPPPPVRELRGADLLRALAEELENYDENDDDQ